MFKKLPFVIIVFSALLTKLFPQDLLSTRKIKNDKDLLKSTVWMKGISRANRILKFGTGCYFYSIAKNSLYLITNKHVVEDADLLQFGVNISEKDTTEFKIINIDSLQAKCIYFNEPDSTDLALVDISSIQKDLLRQLDFTVFTEKNLPGKKIINSLDFIDERLVALSFPAHVEYPVPPSPFLLHCSFSTPYYRDHKGKKEFCLNGNMFPGSSGSPIICVKKKNKSKHYYLLGTNYFGYGVYEPLVETRYDIQSNSLVKTKEIEATASFEYIHMFIAIKSEKIRELLKK